MVAVFATLRQCQAAGLVIVSDAFFNTGSVPVQ
jgi:hypothetical protein